MVWGSVSVCQRRITFLSAASAEPVRSSRTAVTAAASKRVLIGEPSLVVEAAGVLPKAILTRPRGRLAPQNSGRRPRGEGRPTRGALGRDRRTRLPGGWRARARDCHRWQL